MVHHEEVNRTKIKYKSHANPSRDVNALPMFVQAYEPSPNGLGLIPKEIVYLGTVKNCYEVEKALSKGTLTKQDAIKRWQEESETMVMFEGEQVALKDGKKVITEEVLYNIIQYNYGADFSNCYFEGVRISTSEGRIRNFAGAEFYKCKFDAFNGQNVNFEGALFQECYIENANFNRADMTGIKILITQVKEAEFIATNMTNAHFMHVLIEGTEFYKTKFDNAIMESVYFYNVKAEQIETDFRTVTITMGGATEGEIAYHREQIEKALNVKEMKQEIDSTKQDYKYYSTQRPISIGTYPKENIIDIHNYDSKTYVSEIEQSAWGELHYSKPLTPEQEREYEMVGCPSNKQRVSTKESMLQTIKAKGTSSEKAVGAKPLDKKQEER